MDKLKFVLKTAFYLTLCYAVIGAYFEYQGILDIRLNTSQEQAYQARLTHAKAIIARDVFPHGEYAEAANTKAVTVWDALHRKGK